MVAIGILLPELRKLVEELNEDLLARSIADTKIDAGLRQAFTQIEKGHRTAQAFEVWREDYLDQVAVAWVLACVFVRFMEDNHLIDECWLAGEGERRKLAEDTHELYFRAHPHDTDREYLQHVFREVGKIPAAKDLFAEGKTPLWAVAPSGDTAMALLKFWREMDAESGHLQRSFQVENGDTRFLGDLYQELSERAKKKFALLQTPVFVEEFILDRTLTPAIAEFGLEKVRMIDPTCGSGHFLLGGFARLFDLWSRPEYTTGNAEKDAQKALDGVWGVDINPFAVAIARFRLTVAAVQACAIKRLKQAPGWAIHLASGDSLLFGSKPSFGGSRDAIGQQLNLFEVPRIYATEDRQAVQDILSQGYHVVVGNPPYITVKDEAQNAAYRERFFTCHRQYSLGVPFTQRFWELAIQHEEGQGGSGYIGMITANSFMKREFGKKLIEEFFPKVDLTHLIDTSGAYIPGHTTSTVILLGRGRKPVSSTIRAVLGIKGEAGVPEDPASAVVWRSIVRNIDLSNGLDAHTSSADLDRSKFAAHPWSIGGGGATDVQELLNANGSADLASMVKEIGFGALTRDDDVFLLPQGTARRLGIEDGFVRKHITGENVREWSIVDAGYALWPYDEETLRPELSRSAERYFWSFRRQLCDRVAYGLTQIQRGLKWFEFSMFFQNRFRSERRIAFASVATHNHFVLCGKGALFNRHAPIIILPDDADQGTHLCLLGLLNSSAACFWMKQVMSCKGLGGQGGGIKPEHWSRQYEFTGTQLERFPVPDGYRSLLPLARCLHEMAQASDALLPSSVVKAGHNDLANRLLVARQQYEALRRQMVAQQEELDWKVYALFRLCPDTTGNLDMAESLHPEERPVERLLKSRIAKGERSIFYDVQVYRGTGALGGPTSGRIESLAQKRLTMIRENAEVRMIEQLDFKRRWQIEPWEQQEQRALRNWLLDRLETSTYRKGTKDGPELTTAAGMEGVASADAEFLQVAALYRGRPDFDLAVLVAELVEGESVPFLPVLRYKPSGLRKREVWERTWGLQRQEDAGQNVGQIPVPPKYATADFLKTDFWRLRGKLDVPKERWISYPHCSTESDKSLVVGWAGWNHLEQAMALVAYYDARKRQGWDAKRLSPLLAGLDQLLPWIHQWHPKIDPEFGETAGQSYQTMLENDAHELGLTLEDVRNWKPPETSRRRRRRDAAAEDEE